MQSLKKAIFLFLLCYIFLYTNSTQYITTFLFQPIWNFAVPWFAALVGETENVQSIASGSGDTWFDLYSMYFFAVVSVIFAIVVSIIDYKRPNYNHLHKWFLILIRYFVAYQMISYGYAKIFYLQFGPPTISGMNTLLGDKSPMGLLWAFMGFSKTYCIFTGVAEFVGGVLLFSRKTTLLGAIITLGVMTNVMMLNYCFDVPVKFFSTHMVVFSLIIIGFWGKNVIDFFFRGKAFEPVKIADVVPQKWQKIKFYLKWAVLIIYITNSAYTLNGYAQQYKNQTPAVAFHGLYEVGQFSLYRDGGLMEHPPAEKVWKELDIRKDGRTVFKRQKGNPYYNNTEIDTVNQEITFFKMKDDSIGTKYQYKMFTDSITLNGRYENDSLAVILKERKPFLLTSRKFNWVQQHPFHR
ncbi:MAG: hypothetical protein AAGA77_10620 [Bacteroidota bacterium]